MGSKTPNGSKAKINEMGTAVSVERGSKELRKKKL